MRKAFTSSIEHLAADDRILFVTGDLGYNALENLRDILKDRFINAGVAEQNMIGVAAGLAHKGYKVFCYSIAPFITYRCLEQIRIDVCFHQLPVFIIGNGGGYGYGIMGATHHAISDIACMSSLPDLTCYVPAFKEDVALSIAEMVQAGKPAYLRLGLGKNNPSVQASLECINPVFVSPEAEATLIALGPVINNTIEAIEASGIKNKINLFSAVKIPFDNFGDAFLKSLQQTKKLLVIEEHVSRGGIAEYIALNCLNRGLELEKFRSLCASGYPDKRYGDQNFHQVQSGLDKSSILQIIKDWLKQ